MSYEKKKLALRFWLLGRGYLRAVKALEFGLAFHRGTRKDGVTPEFSHQVDIASFLRTLAIPPESMEVVLAVGLLHDVAEDYDVSLTEIESRFGPEVAEPVWLLTKVHRGEKKSMDAYFAAIAKHPIAAIVKGADRIHNVQTMRSGGFSVEKQTAYTQEVRDYFLPMLKSARREFPEFEPAFENIKHMLTSQLELVEAALAAGRKS